MTTVRGLHVPLVTPFDEAGAVDLAALERLAGEVLDAGADGLVALATTAEASSLDERERDAVVAVCARVAAERGAALIVGAGTNDTRTTIARHEALADIDGVTASLAVVPYYVRPSEAAIVAHFQAVAARSPVPLVLYNIPYRTGRGLGAAALLELAATRRHRRPQAGRRRAWTSTRWSCWRTRPSDFAVLCGDDPFLLPLLLMGGAGAIAASAHLCTERFAALIADAARRPPRRRPRPRRGAAGTDRRAVRRAQPGGAQGACSTTPAGSPRRICACRWRPPRRRRSRGLGEAHPAVGARPFPARAR